MKKILAILLSVVLAFSAAVPCFAKSDKCDCGQAPIIYVAALGSGDVIRDAGTENERILFRPDTMDVIKDLIPVLPAAALLVVTGNYDSFGDVLISCVNKVFGDLALDGNGNSKPNVTSEEFHPESAEHGDHTNYYFGYDFRLDPVENAQKLHAYIEEVKELTHHDTVRFRASSMGGVVAMSYIKLYGTADIETIIFQCCPILGTAVAGELYNGKLEINKDALIRYGSQALPALGNDIGADLGAGLLYTLIEAFDYLGVFDFLLSIADKLVVNLKDRIFDECLIPIFGTLPGIWSFVPDEYYESGKVFMGLDSSTQAGLIKKLDFYHYEVQCKAEELLKGAQAQGTTVYILCGYNMQRTPLVTAYMETSDATVDTKYASCGATCAKLGSTLGDGYKQQKFTDKNYISPDGIIDASTCILPESTWFVKDMLHCKIHSGHDELYNWMFTSDKQLTVFDNAEYPQFLQNDTVNNTLTPVTAPRGEINDAVNLAFNSTSILNVVRMIFAFVKPFMVK